MAALSNTISFMLMFGCSLCHLLRCMSMLAYSFDHRPTLVSVWSRASGATSGSRFHFRSMYVCTLLRRTRFLKRLRIRVVVWEFFSIVYSHRGMANCSISGNSSWNVVHLAAISLITVLTAVLICTHFLLLRIIY